MRIFKPQKSAKSVLFVNLITYCKVDLWLKCIVANALSGMAAHGGSRSTYPHLWLGAEDRGSVRCCALARAGEKECRVSI
jgi:hypothetical protein